LLDIYTPLDTTELERPESEEDVRRHLSDQQGAKRISAQQMLNRQSKLVLLGDPGSGKSTLVNFICHVLAMANLHAKSEKWIKRLQQTGPWDHNALLPIRIVLRDFVEWLRTLKGRFKPTELFQTYLQERLKTEGFADLWPTLHEMRWIHRLIV